MFVPNCTFNGNLQHIGVTDRSDQALTRGQPHPSSPVEVAREGAEPYRAGPGKITIVPFSDQVVTRHPATQTTPWEAVEPLYQGCQINDSMLWGGSTLASMLNVPLEELQHISIDPDTCHIQHVQRQRDNAVVSRDLGRIEGVDQAPDRLGVANTALESYRRNKFLFEQIGVDINDLSGLVIELHPSTGHYHLYRYRPIPAETTVQPQDVKTIFNAYTGWPENTYRRDSVMPLTTFRSFDDAFRCHQRLLDIAFAR